MNKTEIKSDFYQRYSASDNFLHFTANGLLCTLLGHIDIEGAPSLNCGLSMRVQMFACRLGGRIINLQNTQSDKCLSYNFGTNPALFPSDRIADIELLGMLEKQNIEGMNILYDSTIPPFLSDRVTFNTTLTESALKVSGIEKDKLSIAALSSCGRNTAPFLGTLYSEKGYCTLLSNSIPKNYPLPLSGYKILSAHCTEKEVSHTKAVKSAFASIHKLYPNIMTVSDITPEMFNSAKSTIKDKKSIRYIYHLINENQRIQTAIAALSRCNIKVLFHEMNNSEESMERFYDIGSEHKFLARCARRLEGSEAVRCWENGIIVIARDENIDHISGMIATEFESNIGYKPTFCVSDIF